MGHQVGNSGKNQCQVQRLLAAELPLLRKGQSFVLLRLSLDLTNPTYIIKGNLPLTKVHHLTVNLIQITFTKRSRIMFDQISGDCDKKLSIIKALTPEANGGVKHGPTDDMTQGMATLKKALFSGAFPWWFAIFLDLLCVP